MGLIVVHALTIGVLLVNVKVSDPKLGLLLVGGIVASAAVFISKKDKWKTMVSPLMGVVAILLTMSLLAPYRRTLQLKCKPGLLCISFLS